MPELHTSLYHAEWAQGAPRQCWVVYDSEHRRGCSADTREQAEALIDRLKSQQPAFSAEALVEGTSSSSLGPAYFDARTIAAQVMADFEAKEFAPLIGKAVEAFAEQLQSMLDDTLIGNAEYNCH